MPAFVSTALSKLTAMYDASKYADDLPSLDDRPSLTADNSAAVTLRHEVGQFGQFSGSERQVCRHRRPLPVSTSIPNGLVFDAASPPSVVDHTVIHNGGATSGSREAVNGLSSSGVSRRRYVGPRLDVPAALTASLDDGTLMSPDSAASTLSSPADIRPNGDLFSPTTASGRCRVTSLADEYFPVTLGGRRSTDPGQSTSTSNGRHHRQHHSHHRRHRQHNGQSHGQGHSQGHGRPSSGQSSSSSNSRSSVGRIYPAATTSNGAVVNGIRYLIIIIIIITGEVKETSFLFQRCSVLVQRFNAILFHDSLPAFDCTG